MIRKTIKRWLYGSCPGFAGRFPYFGTNVYFPKGSVCFIRACQEGIFEASNTSILQALARPGATFFDVGANIGLMALPVLQIEPTCRVVSFEPSPNVLPHLRRTVAESQYRDRWLLIPKAVGTVSGKVAFNVSGQANDVYDGIRPTQRAATVRQEQVEVTTLDESWRELGTPRVSHIKIDVEGGDLDVLLGAHECLSTERPAVLIEWNRLNFAAYGHSSGALLDFAVKYKFQLLAAPSLVEVSSQPQMELQMTFTENFLLLPKYE